MNGLARALLSVAILVLGAACSPCSQSVPAPQRIILFSMDTVRADHVSGYGPLETTPTLEDLAAEGVLFRDVYAASSYTIPSHMSIFTGLDPAEHGVHRMHARLHPGVQTLASHLRGAGYRTQSFNEGVFVDARFGFDQGFDQYETLSTPLVFRESLKTVVEWMRAQGDEPYFLFLHTYLAHFPYGGYDRYREENPERNLPTRDELRARAQAFASDAADPELHYLCTLYNQLANQRGGILECGENRPGEEFRQNPHFDRDLAAIVRGYDQSISRVDLVLAVVRRTLVKLGQWEDTLLVVTSDHGDAFYEHELYRHAFVPFDEVLRVPLVISYPRRFGSNAGRVVGGLISHLDLLPTILSIARLQVPAGLQGMDLTPVMQGAEQIPRDRAVFPAVLRAAQMEQVPLRRVVVKSGRKLIHGHELFGDAEGYLFDLESDPGELENLRTTRAEEFDELAKIGRNYEASLSKVVPLDQRTGRRWVRDESPPEKGANGAPQLSPEERSRLGALGYAN